MWHPADCQRLCRASGGGSDDAVADCGTVEIAARSVGVSVVPWVEMTPQADDPITPIGPEPAPIRPSVAALFVAFLRLGLTAFGGPAMVAYIRELAIACKRWLGERCFTDGVALCQSIPGATATSERRPRCSRTTPWVTEPTGRLGVDKLVKAVHIEH